MVMLFSFAIIATILTMINVGVNESGNGALSTVSKASAAGGIEYQGDLGQAIQLPSSGGCLGLCSGPVNPPGGGGGGGPADPTVKATQYSCAVVTASGECRVTSIVTQDTYTRTVTCDPTLYNGGTVVARGGQAAVNYVRGIIGNFWNPYRDGERMYRHLTGTDLGIVPKPIGWADLAGSFNGAPEKTEGLLRWECTKRIIEAKHSGQKAAFCAPKNDGRPFPYAVGYYVVYKNHLTAEVDGIAQHDWRIASQTCIYVNPNTPPPKVATVSPTCYWNIQHNGYYSTNRAAIASGGTLTSIKPSSPPQNARQPWVTPGSTNLELKDCTQSISMDANLSLADGYAYYRLQGSANYKTYQFYIWDTSYTGGRQLVAEIREVANGVAHKSVYGTHSCATNPPYRQYDTHGSLPNISFSYSDCKRNTEWTCQIPHNPRINGVDNAVQLMRDGNYIRTDLGGVNIAGNGIRDINSKSVGTVADGNMSYMVRVVDGSSPFNGTNANAEKQYFELWKSDQKTETQWNTWLSSPNANKTNYLSFYWSSDNGAKWQMTYQAKINTAEFAVPWQESTHSGAGTKWMPESNVDCAGVKTSNPATVLRSVSSDGR